MHRPKLYLPVKGRREDGAGVATGTYQRLSSWSMCLSMVCGALLVVLAARSVKFEEVLKLMQPTPHSLLVAEVAAAARRMELKSASGHSFIIATSGNAGNLDVLRNLGCALDRHEYGVVVLADGAVMNATLPRNMHSVLVPDREDKGALAAGRAVLEAGWDVLYVDANTAICAGFAHEVAGMVHGIRGADVAFLAAESKGNTLAPGVFYARATNVADRFLKAARIAGVDATACRSPKGERVRIGISSRPQYCRWNDETTVAVLPPARFPTGCTRFKGKPLHKTGDKWVRGMCADSHIALLHYSCYGKPSKVMRRQGHWFLDNAGRCRSPRPGGLS